MGAKRSGIRWRAEGWELRCDGCAGTANTASYWPLTDEFWDRRHMTRCRACHAVARRQRDKAKYQADLAFRELRKAQSRAYRAESAGVISIKRKAKKALDAAQSKARYWDNPDMERAKSRAYYERNRDAILEKRRANYRKKAA